MKKRRTPSGRRAPTQRRWHIPPPLIHGPETLEGGGILKECQGAIGVVLWQAFRDAMLWSTSDPTHRAEVFSGSGAVEYSMLPPNELSADDQARLRPAFRLFSQLVEGGGVREEQLSRACRQISDWADENDLPGTALAFAQNAALAARTDPAAAFWVATLAVRANDHARAEVWFRRAIGLARQSRDWRMYSRAFGGLGNLYMRRGNLPAARRLHTRALRGARRGGMRREQAGALHDLFAVAVETSNVVEAERLAKLALEKYGQRNRRVHVLAHDVAYFWMEQGHFARAEAVFQAVLPLIPRPVERLFVLADLARAAGGTGNRELAFASAEQVLNLSTLPELQTGGAAALLEVARGFLSLRELERARAAATQSLESAIRFRESKVRFAAESLLNAMDSSTLWPPSTQAVATERDAGDELADEFVRTLEVIAGEAH